MFTDQEQLTRGVNALKLLHRVFNRFNDLEASGQDTRIIEIPYTTLVNFYNKVIVTVSEELDLRQPSISVISEIIREKVVPFISEDEFDPVDGDEIVFMDKGIFEYAHDVFTQQDVHAYTYMAVFGWLDSAIYMAIHQPSYMILNATYLTEDHRIED